MSMETMIDAYFSNLTILFDNLDDNNLTQGKIDAFKHLVLQHYTKYEMELVQGETMFRNSSEYRMVEQLFKDSTVLYKVIDTRFTALIDFMQLMTHTITDIDSVRKLRNDTANTYTHAKTNEQFTIYTLYLNGICSVDHVSVNIMNDPSVNGYLELLKKQIDKQSQAH